MMTRANGMRIMMIMMLSAASYFVFAATGTKKTTKSVTTKKTTYRSFSLRSGFEFKGSKLLSVKSPAGSNQVQFNSLALIRSGQVTYGVPFTHKVNVKSGSQPVKSYNNVEVKVVNIRL